MAEKNAFNAASQEVCELFGDYIEGGPERAALVVSDAPLDGRSKNALVKSMSALGYGDEGCSFVTLGARDAAVEGGDIRLDGQALYLLIEGIDPLFVVAADRASGLVLGEAYRMEVDLNVPIRVLGRPGVAFDQLSELLGDPVGKRKVWELMKTLK